MSSTTLHSRALPLNRTSLHFIFILRLSVALNSQEFLPLSSLRRKDGVGGGGRFVFVNRIGKIAYNFKDFRTVLCKVSLYKKLQYLNP